MRVSKVLITLSFLLLVLTIVSSGFGLFWTTDGSQYEFLSIHNTPVAISGQGIYANDSLFIAAGFRGTDFVTLVIVCPLFFWLLWMYSRKLLWAGVALNGLLSYFLYNAASLAMGAHYNALLLVYTAMLGISLSAFVVSFQSISPEILTQNIQGKFPYRRIGSFLLFAGIVLVFVWLSDLVPALLSGQVPKALAHYTTIVTYPIDLGLIAPYSILTGCLLFRRNAQAYLFAASLLILCTLIGLVVLSQTIFQVLAGVPLSNLEIMVYVLSFMTMALLSAYFTWAYFASFQPEIRAESENSMRSL